MSGILLMIVGYFLIGSALAWYFLRELERCERWRDRVEISDIVILEIVHLLFWPLILIAIAVLAISITKEGNDK